MAIRSDIQIEAQRSGFDLERKKDTADVQFSRLLRKPRKRNGAEFFRRGAQSGARTRMPVGHQFLKLACLPFQHLCMWRSESGSRREASPRGKRSNTFLCRLLSGEVPYQLGYHSMWRRTEVSILTAFLLPTVFWTGVSAG